MKKIISLFAFLTFFSSAQALEPELTGKCFLQTAHHQTLSARLKGKRTHYLVGRLTLASVGEQDPYVLGDTGILVLATTQGHGVVLEAKDDAPITAKLNRGLEKGYKYVGIRKSCLGSVGLDSPKGEALKDVAVEGQNLKGPVQFFEFKI